jgi:lambda family phage tail tape measure protein
MGWAEGGYTGDGGKYQPAGIVHAGEFVLNKEATSGIGPTGRAFLERLNRRGYADGGFVSPISGGGSSSPIARSTTNNNVFNMNFSGNTSRDTASQVALRVSRELQRSGKNA